MKKTFLIVGLLVLAASCQKEVIRPNGCSSEDRTVKSTAISTNPDGGIPDPDAPELSGGTIGGDEGTGSGDDNGITDPMRKKDKKDNK